MEKLLRFAIFLLLVFTAVNVFAQGGACPANAPVQSNTCFFVAATGSDANSGTSESSPWQHAPGMAACTGTCASIKPAPGEGFIFRGGDTWHAGNPSATPYTGGGWDLYGSWGNDATCIYEGTQAGCIYYGVDPTWYSGSSWARPILTGDNPTSTSTVSSCAHQVSSPSYGDNDLIEMAPGTILDSFELTGMCIQDTSESSGIDNTYIAAPGTGYAGSGMSFIRNIYFHGWTATTTSYGLALVVDLIGGTNNGLQTLDHIVVDGSDSVANAAEWGAYPSFYHFRDSMITNVSDGVGQWCHDIHDNIFQNIVPIVGGGHTNVLECNADASGNAVNQPQNTPNVVYNNIVRHVNSNVMLWFCPNAIPEYWFNNLIYDSEGEGWSVAGPPTYPGCPMTGGQYMFNNTLVDGGPGGWFQPCNLPVLPLGGRYLTVYNEHLINTPYDGSSSAACAGGPSSSTNVSMSDATATSQGYTRGSPGTYLSNTCANDSTTPCAPTSSTSGTVSKGTNEAAYCTALAGYSSETAIGTDAANACHYATTDGCAYNTTTHTMTCPAQNAKARGNSANWDSGAYQYTTGSAPAPPTNATAKPVQN